MADAPKTGTNFETKSSGYGMFSVGSKVEVFGGLNQSLFMGSKSATTLGFTNSFNVGPKTDFSMGPTVSFNFSPSAWDPDTKLKTGDRASRWFAKYDFSNNKTFAFQIAPEGSSTYATTAKFNCTQGFQAIGGISSVGQVAYDAYTKLIAQMGEKLLVTNSIMALANLAALGPAETNMSDTNYKNTGATVALGLIPALINMSKIHQALTMAISVAAEREDVFKSAIHAESVLQLTKELVFLGSAGVDPVPLVPPAPFISFPARNGAGLQLKDGKATLSSRNIAPLNIIKPFKKKKNDTVTLASPWGTLPTEYPGGPYVDFNDTAAAAVEVVPQQITAYGQTIKIAAGYVPLSAPPEVLPLPSPGFMNPAEPPSLLLTATGPTAKIQAETFGSFNVIAPTISLATDSTPTKRGLFINTLPTPSIELVQSPVSKISFDDFGEIDIKAGPKSVIYVGTSEIELTCWSTKISMDAANVTIKGLGTKIVLSGPTVKVGNSLKVIG